MAHRRRGPGRILTDANLALFLGASLALLVAPGPAVLYIATRSMAQGRAAGLLSALGLAAGGLVQVAAVTLGAASFLAESPRAFALLRYAGAAYLLYLGVQQLRARGPLAALTAAAHAERRRIFVDGLLVSLLNPKALFFFFAFLPQFADPARGPLGPQLAGLGALFLCLAFLTDSMYAVAAGTAAAWIRARPMAAELTRWLSAAVYFALAAVAAAGPL